MEQQASALTTKLLKTFDNLLLDIKYILDMFKKQWTTNPQLTPMYTEMCSCVNLVSERNDGTKLESISSAFINLFTVYEDILAKNTTIIITVDEGKQEDTKRISANKEFLEASGFSYEADRYVKNNRKLGLLFNKDTEYKLFFPIMDYYSTLTKLDSLLSDKTEKITLKNHKAFILQAINDCLYFTLAQSDLSQLKASVYTVFNRTAELITSSSDRKRAFKESIPSIFKSVANVVETVQKNPRLVPYISGNEQLVTGVINILRDDNNVNTVVSMFRGTFDSRGNTDPASFANTLINRLTEPDVTKVGRDLSRTMTGAKTEEAIDPEEQT